MNDYIFPRQGLPSIYGRPLEADLGSTDTLRGLGSYTFLRGAEQPVGAKMPQWMLVAAAGVVAYAMLRKR